MSNTDIVMDKIKQNWIIASVCFAAFIGTLDSYIVNISLPAISKYFNVSTSQVASVTLIYLLVITSLLIIFGKIVDKTGVKKVFVWGFAFFTVGSLCCGISPGLNWLILSRILQAVGGSMLYASVFAIIPKFLPSDIRGFAFGMIATAAALGITLGAPLGGIITGLLNWHWIFLVNVPIGIVAFFVSKSVIPDEKPHEVSSEEKYQFDIPGAIMIFVCLIALVYGLNNGQTLGWTSVSILGSLAVSLITFVVFLIWEMKMPDALVDLTLFKDSDFTITNMAALLGFMVLSGTNFLLPFYLIVVKGFSETTAGMVILIYSMIYIFVSPVMGRMSDHVKPKILCTIGMIIGGITCLIFAFTLQGQSIIPVVVFLALLGVSYGFFVSPNNNQIMIVAPEEKMGVSSAVFKTLTNLSLILGVITFETVFMLFIPHTSAMDASSLMSGHINTALLLNGFQDAFIVGGVICILTAVCCIFIKKDRPEISCA